MGDRRGAIPLAALELVVESVDSGQLTCIAAGVRLQWSREEK